MPAVYVQRDDEVDFGIGGSVIDTPRHLDAELPAGTLPIAAVEDAAVSVEPTMLADTMLLDVGDELLELRPLEEREHFRRRVTRAVSARLARVGSFGYVLNLHHVLLCDTPPRRAAF